MAKRSLILATLAVVATMAGAGAWVLFGPLGFQGFTVAQGTLIWAAVAGVAGLTGLGVALYLVVRDWAERRELRDYESLTGDPLEITYLIPKEQYKKTGFAGLARQLLEDAEREADRIRKGANERAEEEAAPILADARSEAEETLAEAQEALSSAEAQAEATLSEAQQEAQRQAEAALSEAEREARRQAEETLSQAQQEAQRQAEETLSQAQQEAQRQAEETLRQAQEAARQESDSVLESARKRAQIHEARAKLAAQRVLARAREDVTGDAKEAYDKLLSTLQEILSAAEGIESVWGNRAEELSDDTTLRIEEVDHTLLESLAPDEVEAAGSTGETASVTEIEGAPLLETAAIAGAEDGEATSPEGRSGEDTRQELSEGVAQAAGEPAVVDVDGEDESSAVSAREEAATRQEISEAAAVYAGEVELVIEPFADMARIVELHGLLQNVDGVRVISTAGSWNRGTTITISLDRPLSLNEIRAQMPNFEATHQPPESDGLWGATVGQLRNRAARKNRIAIGFGTASESSEMQEGMGPNGA